MAQSSDPLTTAQETKLADALCRAWFGVRETVSIDVHNDVTLTVVHTKYDTVDLIVKFDKAPCKLVSCPPDALSDVNQDLAGLATGIWDVVAQTFGSEPSAVRDFENVAATDAALAYKATLNLADTPATQNAPE